MTNVVQIDRMNPTKAKKKMKKNKENARKTSENDICREWWKRIKSSRKTVKVMIQKRNNSQNKHGSATFLMLKMQSENRC